MQNDCGWIVQHFSKDTFPRVRDRLARLRPDTWTELQQRWNVLAKDIQATLHKDPAGAETQALLRRWKIWPGK